MKLYAFVRREDGERLIHVWDAERVRQEHPEAERERYFSTELDASRRQEMVLVHRDGLMFFRYKELPKDGTPPSFGQTLTHLKVKEYLSKMSRVKLILPEGVMELWIDQWRPEYRVGLEDGSTVIADMAAHIRAGNPPERISGWPAWTLFEVTVTHPTEKEKLLALENLGWPVIELPIDQSLRIPEGLSASEETVLAAEQALEQKLMQGISARILTEPGRSIIPRESLFQRLQRLIDEIITN